MDKYRIDPTNAPKVKDWIATRGGIAHWKSVNLSNPNGAWSTPALTTDGTPYPKPTWEADSKPDHITTSESDVLVAVPKEVKRFHVAVRRGGNGLQYKLTDAASAKLRKAVSKAYEQYSKESFYRFDYMTQEAVIYIDDQLIPLAEYAA